MSRIRFSRGARRRGASGRGLIPVLLAAAVAGQAPAEDWPQWRGPLRSGISAEKGWNARWSPSGPKRLWSARVGQGFSAVAVVGNRVYTMGNAGGQDSVVCLDAATGRPVWTHRYACDAGDHAGPRATPTVRAGRVYTLSREGLALCLDAATGRPVWQCDLRRQTGAQVPRWGFAGSPTIEGSRVIYNVGDAGTAVDRATGRVVWRSGTGVAGYASPVAYTLGPQRGMALFTGSGLVAVNPATGRRLWEFPWDTSFDVNAADPIFSGDTVFISSNYNRGGALVRFGSGPPRVLWQNRNMRNHFNSCVLVNGHLYGNDQNTLKCIDLRSGDERWRLRGIGKGGLIASDGKLIVLTERGELVLAAAVPDRYTELARARVLHGTCWTPPVLAHGRIYCRSHEGELVCVDVRSG